jgi:hypothetical protein
MTTDARPEFSALAKSARNERLRNWFYYRARHASGKNVKARLQGSYTIETIGDAIRAGKSEDAISSAFAGVFHDMGEVGSKSENTRNAATA